MPRLYTPLPHLYTPLGRGSSSSLICKSHIPLRLCPTPDMAAPPAKNLCSQCPLQNGQVLCTASLSDKSDQLGWTVGARSTEYRKCAGLVRHATQHCCETESAWGWALPVASNIRTQPASHKRKDSGMILWRAA